MRVVVLSLFVAQAALAQSQGEVIQAAPAGSSAETQAPPPAGSAAETQAPPTGGTTETQAPPAGSPATDAPAAPSEFYKGELGNPNAAEIDNPNDALFIGVGYYNTGGLTGEHYARLTPSLDLFFDVMPEKQAVVRLSGPVNVLLYDRTDTSENHGLGKTREADYDEARDFVKFIKELRLGRKEDKLFVNVGLTSAVSLGHGTVMRRYNPNLDIDRSRVGAQVDAYNDYGGFETFAADLTGQTQIFGGLAFVKPLSMLSDNPVARTWSIGVHYTTDLAAPTKLKRSAPTGVNPSGKVLLDASGYPRYDSTQVGIIGFDTEVKPLRLGNLIDLKLYADYSQLVDAGSGMTMGLLLRSNLGARPLLSALRMRLEGRLYDGNYLPQYFDSLYEVQKFQLLRGVPTGHEPTKYAAVTQTPKASGGASVYGEATYALVDNFVVGAGLERIMQSTDDANRPDLYNLLVSVELPAFELLRLFASYQKLGFTDLGDAFKRGEGKGAGAFESDTVLTSQARLMVLPILFVSAGARQTFQWDEFLKNSEGDIVGGYSPKLDYLLMVEVGYEMD